MPTPSTTPTRRRSLFAAVLAVPLLITLAACGSSDSAQVASLNTGAASASASSTADASNSQLAFAKCMRENGVDMPDPDPNGGFSAGQRNVNPSDPKFQAGLKKCQSLMPSGGAMNRTFDAASQQKMLDLAKCMRQNGVDMPDPQFDANGKMSMDGSVSGLMNNPKAASAMQACRQYAPSGGPGGGPGAGGSS